MISIKYQLISIGHEGPLNSLVLETFLQRTKELGLAEDSISLLDAKNFNKEYKRNSPSVCLYFGSGSPFLHVDILKTLMADAVYIIPIVEDLTQFSILAPPELQVINGFRLDSQDLVESLVARTMESLSLLRSNRRLFISYRRAESRSAAIQLYEFLDRCGFDVFLDTHSIRPGDIFQDELWHRLVDTDVVVLLDTPGFLESKWTEQELARASSMSIGVLQLIWPNHDQEPYSKLCFPIFLKDQDFVNKDFLSESAILSDNILGKISSDVESLRARSLASRQDNLIQEFTTTSRDLNKAAHLQPEKFITLKSNNGHDIVIIPTVGVPHAFTYNQKQVLIEEIHGGNVPEIFLLYDHRNIRDKWLKHLQWLDTHLPLKTLKVTELYKRLKEI